MSPDASATSYPARLSPGSTGPSNGACGPRGSSASSKASLVSVPVEVTDSPGGRSDAANAGVPSGSSVGWRSNRGSLMGGGCPEKGDDKQAEESGVLTAVLPLVRPGAVIVADNIVRDGAVVDPDSTDARVRGVRRFLEMVRDDPRLDATAVQTVGTKGWDGFALVLVR